MRSSRHLHHGNEGVIAHSNVGRHCRVDGRACDFDSGWAILPSVPIAARALTGVNTMKSSRRTLSRRSRSWDRRPAQQYARSQNGGQAVVVGHPPSTSLTYFPFEVSRNRERRLPTRQAAAIAQVPGRGQGSAAVHYKPRDAFEGRSVRRRAGPPWMRRRPRKWESSRDRCIAHRCLLAERERDPIVDVRGVDPNDWLAAAEHVGVRRALEHVFVEPCLEIVPIVELPREEARKVDRIQETEAKSRLSVLQEH